MSKVKSEKVRISVINGLKMANKKSPFWSKSDAMGLLNLFNKNQKSV